MLMRMHAPRRGLCRDAIFWFPLNGSKHSSRVLILLLYTCARDAAVGDEVKIHGLKRSHLNALIH